MKLKRVTFETLKLLLEEHRAESRSRLCFEAIEHVGKPFEILIWVADNDKRQVVVVFSDFDVTMILDGGETNPPTEIYTQLRYVVHPQRGLIAKALEFLFPTYS